MQPPIEPTGYTSKRYTETLAVEGLSPSIGTIGDAFDNGAAETVMGLFKNEAVAKDSLFRPGPLTSQLEATYLVLDWVHWYNGQQLHSTSGYVSPVEFEELYYDEKRGSLTTVAASKSTAWKPGRLSDQEISTKGHPLQAGCRWVGTHICLPHALV